MLLASALRLCVVVSFTMVVYIPALNMNFIKTLRPDPIFIWFLDVAFCQKSPSRPEGFDKIFIIISKHVMRNLGVLSGVLVFSNSNILWNSFSSIRHSSCIRVSNCYFHIDIKYTVYQCANMNICKKILSQSVLRKKKREML